MNKHHIKKTATFDIYLMVIKFAEHICNEYGWKVGRNVLMQCVKWLEMTIQLRPYYGGHYILLSYSHFFVFSNYVKARDILENGIQTISNKAIYDALIQSVETSGDARARWKLFVEWVSTKILKLNDKEINDDNEEQQTAIMANGGMLEPGSKLNIAII